MNLEKITIDESLACGLRQHWVEGTDPNNNDLPFEVSCGAGLGSPWITLSVGEGEEKSEFRLNVTEIVSDAIRQHLGEEPRDVLVWSNEHRSWWRPDRCGYTIHVEAAGRYTAKEAAEICRGANCNFERNSNELPDEIPVREADALAAMHYPEDAKR